MTDFGGGASRLPVALARACDNKKDNSRNAATSLSFVSNGREDFDSQSKCLLSLEGSILLKADGVLMIL